MSPGRFDDQDHLFGQPLEEAIKILTTLFLIILSILLVSIFKRELPDYGFYLHFLFVPIVLASLWWGKRGVVVAGVLATAVIVIAVWQQDSAQEVFSNVVEAVLFFVVSILVGALSAEKTAALENEQLFKRDTAHYFFNPLCIAEGFLELVQQQCPATFEQELGEIKKALERIKKVVSNAINLDKIVE